MKSIFSVVALAAIAGVASPVFACGPPPPEFYAKTEKRVRERFASVDSVVLVTLLDVRKVKKIEMEIELTGEKTTFRIDRVFKGRSKPGNKLILNSYSTCTTSVVKKWDGPSGPIKLSRRWLIYRNDAETQMPPHDGTQTFDEASYDLKVLPGIARTQTMQRDPLILVGRTGFSIYGKTVQSQAELTGLLVRNSAQFVEVRPEAWDPLESTCRHASLSIL